MNTSHPQTKVGLLDLEISQLAKVCCSPPYWGSVRAGCVNEDSVCGVFRTVRRAGCVERVQLILVHVRVPILNFILIDYPYHWQVIVNDDQIPGTVVRTSNLPEEFGRINYLLSDKTGTLIQNGIPLSRSCFPKWSVPTDGYEEASYRYNVVWF